MIYSKQIMVILVLVLLSKLAFADDIQAYLKRAQHIGEELNEQDNSLLALLLKSDILLDKYNDDPVALDLVSQFASTYYAFANEHRKALLVADVGKRLPRPLESVSDYAKYHSKAAVDVVVAAAMERQIVMVNEAHHVSQHRAFTFELLENLWKKGYRYLALESLSSSENLPFSGPLKRDSGYYTKEPMFAFLVKHALELGFKLVPYDSGGANIDLRETQAAKNIKTKIFDQDPEAKVLIHVGYSHIDETGWLAFKLKELLAIDPLTIDQVKFSEKSKPEFELPSYRDVLLHFPNDKPFILQSEQGEIYSSHPTKWDVTVVSPRTNYTANKPNWMIKERDVLALDTAMCKGQFPCMIEVFAFDILGDDESSEIVPIDKTVLYSKTDNKVVLLEKGKSVLIATDNTGQILSKEIVQN